MTSTPNPPILDYHQPHHWRLHSRGGIAAFVLAVLAAVLTLLSIFYGDLWTACCLNVLVLLPLSIGIAAIELIIACNRRHLFTFWALAIDGLVLIFFTIAWLTKH